LNRLVLDASVAAKWFLPDETEPFAAQAMALFSSHVHGAIEILIPDLFFAVAVQESATLITADEKLANAVAAYLPVRWLGAM
jgi:predicted nucleic acid-binding protein